MNRAKYLILRNLVDGAKSYWQLIRSIDVDIRNFQIAIRELLEKDIIGHGAGGFFLTSKGLSEAKRFKFNGFKSLVCPSCEGKGVFFKSFGGLLEKFKELVKFRPRAISEYDQGYIEPKDTIARIFLMYQLGDVQGKDILLLGDDDLTSLALLLTEWPKRVTVLEIDERILEFIDKIKTDKGWNNVDLIHYDVREPTPNKIKGKFDVFFTDPVETIDGIRLFLSRCASTLKGIEGVGYLGLTHLEASRKKWHIVQQDILNMGFVITDIIRNFQTYLLNKDDILNLGLRVVENAPISINRPDIDFYTSNLFRIYAIKTPQPLLKDKVDLGRNLYYDEEAYVTRG
ncbi:MAG: hypothetical protein AMJ45_05705 [Syntrophobacter sp. DG_60]|nr:MAG: hypothetical protein AMJ45_05705 [Syntrophobacter sp. DG_60]